MDETRDGGRGPWEVGFLHPVTHKTTLLCDLFCDPITFPTVCKLAQAEMRTCTSRDFDQHRGLPIVLGKDAS